MARKRRRRKNSGSAVFALVFVLAVVLAVGVFLNKRVFVLRTIQVEGNSYFTENDVIRKAKLNPGGSIWDVKEDDVKAAFDGEGSMHLTDVEVTLPDTVKLTIRESTPHAMATYAGVTLVMDEYCYVIETMGSMPDYAVPVVTGLEVSSCRVGKVLECAQVGMTQSIADVLSALYQAGMADGISELNVANLDSMYLMTRSGMMVKIGDRDNISGKLEWMRSVAQDLAAEGKTTGVLDVSTGKAAYYSPA